MTKIDENLLDPALVGSTRDLVERFKASHDEACQHLSNEEYQQAMALFFDASQTADEMTERFLTVLIKTSPSTAHRALLVEALSWRLRYYDTQYDYHLSVAQTLTGLPREEWIARLETVLVLSQSLVDKLLPFMREVEDENIKARIRTLLVDWVRGIRDLVSNLKTWGMASAQAARVLEWALDNDLEGMGVE
ncbi:MAG: hypothetical protein JSW61_12755 [Candidatus Thorarchaeota archaeon]|nr:MAG: hypothetical protein JSW61_12755 [Candidatus Thorarchaeota archaeon]